MALGSDVSKMHVLRTWMEGQQIGSPLVWMNGVRLPVPSESAYIRSLGRHTLPHVYNKEDLRKLMTASRRASAVIPLKSLRAQYPPAMYKPKAWRGAAWRVSKPGSDPPPRLGCGIWRTFPLYPPSARS